MRKRLLSMVVSIAVMGSFIFGTMPSTSANPPTFTASGGWVNTAYVTWNAVSGANGYLVEHQRSGTSNWVTVDGPLVRNMGGSAWRADIPGLQSGTYTLRVTSRNGSTSLSNGSRTVSVNVRNADRSGFAFSPNSGANGLPGGYQANGTPKSNAQIIYVTPSTLANLNTHMTVGSSVNTDRPTIIRFIGHFPNATLKAHNGGKLINSVGMMEVKAKTRGHNAQITLEGIGNNATLGAGIRVTGGTNGVEIKNFGFVWYQEDGIEFNTDSNGGWVHQNDFFYGSPGGDSDQAKGDGSADFKNSRYLTVSYNKFWDSGKTHLVGNGKSDTADLISIHHNWYEYSDSRHPRVRLANVHVFNNYYRGISTYGVGAAHASKGVFVDSNYFENTHRPMLISRQGTDIASGNGTFSSEDGGIIKAFGNYMDSNSSKNYRPYSSSNTVEFDAYEVSSRTATVPNSVKAKQGGMTYNNFDTNSSTLNSSWYYGNSVQSATAARTTVMDQAGRLQKGDLSYTFSTGDASNKDVMTNLRNMVRDYKGASQSGGSSTPAATTAANTTAAATTTTRAATTTAAGSTSGAQSWNAANNAPSFFSTSGSSWITDTPVSVGGTSYSRAYKLDSNGYVTFTTTGAANVSFVAAPRSGASGRSVGIFTGNSSSTSSRQTFNLSTGGATYTHSITAAGTYTLKRVSGECGVYQITVTPTAAATTTTTRAATTTTTTRAATTTTTTRAATTTTAPAASGSAQTWNANASLPSFFKTNGSSWITDTSVSVGGTTYPRALKLDSAGYITFTTTGAANISFVAAPRGGASGRSVGIFTGTNTSTSSRQTFNLSTGGATYTHSVTAAGTYTIKRVSGECGLYFISVTPTGSSSNNNNTSTAATTTTWNFSNSAFSGLSNRTFSSNTTIQNLRILATSSATMSIPARTLSLGGTNYTHCLSTGGGGTQSQRAVSVNAKAGTVTIRAIVSHTGSDTRTLRVTNASGTVLGSASATNSAAERTITINNFAGGDIFIMSAGSNIDIFRLQVTN